MEGNYQFATLQEYGEDFMAFLTNRGEAIFPPEQ